MRNIIAFLLFFPAQLIFSAELNSVVASQGRDRCERLLAAVEADGFERSRFLATQSEGYVALTDSTSSEVVWRCPEIYLNNHIPTPVVGRAICAYQLKRHPQRLVRKGKRKKKALYAIATGLCSLAAGIGAVVYGNTSGADKVMRQRTILGGAVLSGLVAPAVTFLMLPSDIRSNSEVELSYAQHQAQQQDEVKSKKLEAVHKYCNDKAYQGMYRFLLKSEFDFEEMANLAIANDYLFLRKVDAQILRGEAQRDEQRGSSSKIILNTYLDTWCRCCETKCKSCETNKLSDTEAGLSFILVSSCIAYGALIGKGWKLLEQEESRLLDKFKHLTFNDLMK